MADDTAVTDTLRLGAPGGALADAHAREVASALEQAGHEVEIVAVDADVDAARAALRAGEYDLLVHALTALPPAQPAGLVIAAIPRREDPRDAAVTRDGTPLHQLPIGATVGAGSARRIAQVRIRNPRVEVQDASGDVDERLQRVADGELDAVIVSVEALNRLSPDARGLSYEPLGLAEWPTTAGQGALVVEATSDAGPALLDALAAIDHLPTRLAVTAERRVPAELDVDHTAAVAVHAVLDDDVLRVRAIVYSEDGSSRVGADLTHPVGETESLDAGYIRSQGSGNGADAADGDHPLARAAQAGSEVAHRLLERGAADLAPRESP